MTEQARMQRYRDRADHLRRMAKQADDADVRAELQKIASQYETLAEGAGRSSASQ